MNKNKSWGCTKSKLTTTTLPTSLWKWKCSTLYNPVDRSLPGSSVHGIVQSRILEWVAISFSRGSSRPRDQTWVSRIVDRRFTVWATREVQLLVQVVKLRLCSVPQSPPTHCDPMDCSPLLQASILEWVAISFSNAWKWKLKVKSLSRI